MPADFAHYLLWVPDETLRRGGRILKELLRRLVLDTREEAGEGEEGDEGE